MNRVSDRIAMASNTITRIHQWYSCDNLEDVQDYYRAELKATDLALDTLICIRDHLQIHPGLITIPDFNFKPTTLRKKWVDGKTTVHRNGDIKIYNKNDASCIRNGKLHGYTQEHNRLKEYFEGELINCTWYNGQTISKRETYYGGSCQVLENFNSFGRLIHKTDFSGGIKRETVWYDDGQLKLERDEKGEKEYYPDGTISCITVKTPDGYIEFFFDEEGVMIMNNIKKLNIVRRRRFHSSNNRLAYDINSCDGAYHGTFRTFSEDGNLVEWTEYHEGRRHGLSQEWKGEQLVVLMTYIKGAGNGWCRKWWPNGNLREESYLVDGKCVGRLRRWSEEGKLLKDAVI
jgi:antitoxin component YwqK of YwqJK toxin-antitoxin module